MLIEKTTLHGNQSFQHDTIKDRPINQLETRTIQIASVSFSSDGEKRDSVESGSYFIS